MNGLNWRPACAVALLSVSLCGCGGSKEAESDDEPQRPLGAVVIVLDTVRADHLSCYGYDRETTPAIDALAARGVRFEHVVSDAPWTLPSVAALLSGEHAARVLDRKRRCRRSLTEPLAKAGFATAASTEGGWVSRQFGMDRGFDFYHEEQGPVQWARDIRQAPQATQPAGGVENTFRIARQWLAANHERPFFLLIHSYEPHTPYTHGEFAQALDAGRIGPALTIQQVGNIRMGRLQLTEAEKQYCSALYDGDIRHADHWVGKFLEFLEEIGIRDRTVVAVTSDHGEDMGEHFHQNIFGHGHSLRDDQLLVPLVIHDPTREFAGRSIPAQVRLVDVMPTVVDLLGVSIDHPIEGRSLVPYMTGKETAHRVAISAETQYGPQRIAIRDGRYKLIKTVGPAQNKIVPVVPPVAEVQLYDLEADPAEQLNLARSKPHLVKILSDEFNERVGEVSQTDLSAKPEALDKKLIERLRSLGYFD